MTHIVNKLRMNRPNSIRHLLGEIVLKGFKKDNFYSYPYEYIDGVL